VGGSLDVPLAQHFFVKGLNEFPPPLQFPHADSLIYLYQWFAAR
jgi:hypothetical protein